ncbi:MAG TPA: chorismate synthase [Candidatus Dormibacteraeota bacterium]|nr:chorismate synthase [Candidatus Dormibacteraeota bacterium]
MLRFFTAGESHGQALIAWISGLPAGVPVDLEFVNREMHRRQLGYGRGGRQKIEKDQAEFLAGVRHGKTIGAPIAIRIENRDWKNWEKALPVEDADGAADGGEDAQRHLTSPRPGHADLAGALKFNFHDARYILERASARETAARTSAGAVAKLLLREFGISVLSHTIAVGPVKLERPAQWNEIESICANLDSPLRCVDAETETRMKAEVDKALRAGDSVGGIFEVVARGVPPGLGSHAQWDEKLDGRLARAVMSIQAVKGVEIGTGIANATSYGSEVQDEIRYDGEKKRFQRSSNRAGGIEGVITNGENVVVRGYLKPISTLRRALGSAELNSKASVKAAYERSDICVVPAAGVIAEAMVGYVLAEASLEKFGGDSLEETRRNFQGYQKQLDEF